MKRIFAGAFGAIVVCGLAALAGPAAAGGYYRHGSYGCDCEGPVTRIVNAGTQVVTTRRVIVTNTVVPHVHVVNHTRVILHRRTILHREIVVHRHNTIDRDITVNRINVAHRFQTIHRRQVINLHENTHRTVHETRTVRGHDCNCGMTPAGYHHKHHWRSHGGRAMHMRD